MTEKGATERRVLAGFAVKEIMGLLNVHAAMARKRILDRVENMST